MVVWMGGEVGLKFRGFAATWENHKTPPNGRQSKSSIRGELRLEFELPWGSKHATPDPNDSWPNPLVVFRLVGDS